MFARFVASRHVASCFILAVATACWIAVGGGTAGPSAGSRLDAAFPPSAAPIAVLLAADTPWDCPKGLEVIHRLSIGFGYLDHVAEVRSLSQPLGRPMRDTPPTGLLSDGVQWYGRDIGFISPFKAAKRQFLATGHGTQFITRIEVMLSADPAGEEYAAALAAIETWLTDFLPEQSRNFGPVVSQLSGGAARARADAAIAGRARQRAVITAAGGAIALLVALTLRLWFGPRPAVTGGRAGSPPPDRS
jgi:hypothetical protein